MEEERDILVLEGEDGEELEMEILDYFSYEDEEYALLTEFDEECSCEHCQGEDQELYIMKVVVTGDMEEFQPVEEDKMEELIRTVEDLFGSDEDSEE